MPQEKQLKSMGGVEFRGEGAFRTNGLFCLLCLVLEEFFEFFFTNSVDSTKLDAFQRLSLNKLKDSEVVELKRLCDLFGSEQSRYHLVLFNLVILYSA